MEENRITALTAILGEDIHKKFITFLCILEELVLVKQNIRVLLYGRYGEISECADCKFSLSANTCNDQIQVLDLLTFKSNNAPITDSRSSSPPHRKAATVLSSTEATLSLFTP